MKTSRLFILAAALFLGTALSIHTDSAQAARSCAQALSSKAPAFEVRAFSIPSGIPAVRFKASDKTFITKTLRGIGIQDPTGLEVTEIAQKLIEHVSARQRDAVKAGDLFAQLSRKFDPAIAKLNKNQQRLADFIFAKATLDLEAFKPSEFVKNDNLPMITKNMRYAHLTTSKDSVVSFMTLLKSYIDKTDLYESIPSRGNGIIGLTEIRDIEAQNMFPVEFKGHDVRHVHYSVGHPLAAGVVFSAARSKNHKRYQLIAGTFEGVDSFQYTWESHLTNHFRDQNLDLEQALIKLARMTAEEINNLHEESGASVLPFENWKPSHYKQYTQNGLTQRGHSQEVEAMVSEYMGYLADPSLRKYTNYAQDPPPGGATQSDHSIHD